MEHEIISMITRLVKLFFAKIPYSFVAISAALAFLAYYGILLGLYKRIKKEESKKNC